MKAVKYLIIAVTLFGAICAWAAPVPFYLEYQGKITDDNGVALNGTYDIVFRILNTAKVADDVPGCTLWVENHTGANEVTITNGLFDVVLGRISALSGLDFSEAYYLEIQVEGVTMAPREEYVPVPYAMRALAGGGGGDNWGIQVVQHDATLTGDGATFQLGINLTNPNTWTGLQTFDAMGAPFAVGSSNLVTDLNSDLLDDQHGSYYLNNSMNWNNGTNTLTIYDGDGALSQSAVISGFLESEVDGDASNELITAFTWNDGTDALTITEAGTDWPVTIDNEADDLSDNTLDDIGNVNTPAPTDGQVLTWVNAVSEWQAITYTGGVTSITGGTGIDPDGASTGDITLTTDMTELTLTGLDAPSATALQVNVDGVTIQINGSDQLEVIPGIYDNYNNWKLQVNAGATTDISAGETVTFQESGLATVSRAGNTITIDAAGDGYEANTDNQALSVGAGAATTSLIQLTGSATDVTLEAGSNITLSEAGNTITIDATGADNDWVKVGGGTPGIDDDMYHNGGYVGIGETAPSYKLEVNSAATVTAIHGEYDADNYGQLGRNGRGVYGRGTTYAIYGINDDTGTYGYIGADNYGVYGRHPGTSTANEGWLGNGTYGVRGLFGDDLDAANYGGWFQNTNDVNVATRNKYGIYTEASGDNGDKIGIYARARSVGATNTGVWAYVIKDATVNVALFACANNPDHYPSSGDWAAYIDGDMGIYGTLNLDDVVDILDSDGDAPSAAGDVLAFDGTNYDWQAQSGAADNDWDGAGTGSMYPSTITDNIGIATNAPDYELDVAGDMGIDDYLHHNDDADCYIRFPSTDRIQFYTSNKNMLLIDGVPDPPCVVVNEDGDDAAYFRVEGDTDPNLIRTLSADDYVGIGTGTPNNKLEINSGSSNRSGLRFTQLTSAYAPGVTADKFLTVDANGDVILRDAAGGGAPINATYITQTPDATLTNEQALSALSSGYLKVTTGTGVVSSQPVPIPVPDGGTGATSFTSGGILYGNGAGAIQVTPHSGTDGYVLTQDAAGAPYWAASGGADNLGNHIATQNLDMAEYDIFSFDYINGNTTTGSGGYGFRDNAGRIEYKHNAGSWMEFPDPPPSGVPEYWYRPAAAAYIQPVTNDNIHVYDSGETYGLYYNGNTNTWGGYFRSTAGGGAAALRAMSDNGGLQTDAYMGYVGSIVLDDAILPGVAVWGDISNIDRVAVLGRTPSNANYAAIVGHSDCWIGGYFETTLDETDYWANGAYGVATNGGTAVGGWAGEATVSTNTGSYGGEFVSSALTGTGVVGGGNASIATLLTGSGGAFCGYDDGLYATQTDATIGVQTSAIITHDCVLNQVLVNAWSAGGTYYKIWGPGVASTLVEDVDGNTVTLYCPEAPEVLFEDYGQDQLKNGFAHIKLDPTFVKNVAINEDHPLRVFIQLEENENCKGVVVKNKTATGFDVVELGGGTSNTPFMYHVVCNRADQELKGGRIARFQDLRFGPGPEFKPANEMEKTQPLNEIKQPISQ
ncbi:hypothetical protein DRQ36_05765 [bacterium]|nr:MAG: hypothetical protein DRQ36_05765 [bacterium]